MYSSHEAHVVQAFDSCLSDHALEGLSPDASHLPQSHGTKIEIGEKPVIVRAVALSLLVFAIARTPSAVLYQGQIKRHACCGLVSTGFNIGPADITHAKLYPGELQLL